MSIYNFNDREHETEPSTMRLNHNLASNRANGTQPAAGYHQMDFMNHRQLNHHPSSSHPPENSVQGARPTSKTAELVRRRRTMLEQLSCFICKGYLIDATTIDECMDSFCKSCIVSHFRTNNYCPKCGIAIQHRNPLCAIKTDKALQNIVYKLVPGLYDAEMKQRRDFYRALYNAQPSSSSSSDNDDDSCSSSIIVQGTSLSGEQYGIVPFPKPFYKPTDTIDLSIEPRTRGENTKVYYDNRRQSIVTCFTGSPQQRDLDHEAGTSFSSVDSQLFKTYLRCPAKLTVLQLKKFIAAKFNIFRDDTIRLLYLNESLEEAYSLIDVAYIYDWKPLDHMQLFYIIERDLTKVSTKDNKHDYETRFGEVSTQTVKRVSIDPQPKFYEEQNNNVATAANNTGGRSMRPRVDAVHGDKKSRVIRVNPASRQYSSNNSLEQKSYSIQTNGSSSREQASRRPDRTVTRQVSSNAYAAAAAQGDHSNRATTTTTTTADNGSRLLRSQTETIKTNDSNPGSSVPKIGLRLDLPNRNNNNHASSNATTSLERDTRNAVVSSNNNNNYQGQLVPCAGNRIGANVAATTQSSMITVAGYARTSESNLVTSISASSASVHRSLVSISSRPHERSDANQGTQKVYLKLVATGGTWTNVVQNYKQVRDPSAPISSASDFIARSSSQETFPSSGRSITATNSSSSSSSNGHAHRPHSGSGNMCTSSANLNLVSFEAAQSAASRQPNNNSNNNSSSNQQNSHQSS